jgi:hypothetical protein
VAQISHLDIGDVWKPTASFTVGGTPTDPTTLTTRLLAPDGTLTTASYSVASLTTVSSPVAKTTTGTFVYSVSIDQAGHWYTRFEGTGAATAAEDSEAIVDPSPFYDNGGLSDQALVSLGEAKAWLGNNLMSTTNDLRIVQAINGASERISQAAGREFKARGTNPETRRFDVRGVNYEVPIGDLMTASTASTTVTFLQADPVVTLASITDFSARPRNRQPWEPVTSLYFGSTAKSYYNTRNVLDVTGYWGFPTIPEDIKHATLQAVAYWLDVDVEHFRQDLAAIPGGAEGGQTVFVGSGPPTVYPLPPEAYQIAVSYRRRLIAA